MVDDNQKASKSGFSWEIFHWVLTFFIGIGTLVTGVWQFKLKHEIDTEQAALKEQVEQTKLVDQMLDRIEPLINKQSSTVKKIDHLTSTAEGVSI